MVVRNVTYVHAQTGETRHAVRLVWNARTPPWRDGQSDGWGWAVFMTQGRLSLWRTESVRPIYGSWVRAHKTEFAGTRANVQFIDDVLTEFNVSIEDYKSVFTRYGRIVHSFGYVELFEQVTENHVSIIAMDSQGREHTLYESRSR